MCESTKLRMLQNCFKYECTVLILRKRKDLALHRWHVAALSSFSSVSIFWKICRGLYSSLVYVQLGWEKVGLNPLRANYCHTWHMENHPFLWRRIRRVRRIQVCMARKGLASIWVHRFIKCVFYTRRKRYGMWIYMLHNIVSWSHSARNFNLQTTSQGLLAYQGEWPTIFDSHSIQNASQKL